jgi:hypothetical protein
MKDIHEISSRAPELIREAGFYLNELRGGRVDPRQLVLRRRVQTEAGEYVTNNLSAMVVRELAQFGVTVKAGEVIDYIIVDQTGKRDPQKAKSLLTYQHWDGYDIEKYTEFLLKAVETLLSPFGYDREKLAGIYGVGGNGKPLDGRRAAGNEVSGRVGVSTRQAGADVRGRPSGEGDEWPPGNGAGTPGEFSLVSPAGAFRAARYRR